MRRRLGFLGLSAIAVACAEMASGTPDPVVTPVPEAGAPGLDSALVGDTSPSPAEVEVPPGDVCGDGGGLARSTWPLRGGCPTRAGWSSLVGPQTSAIRTALAFAGGESAPAIDRDGYIWVGTTDGYVLSLTPGGFVIAAKLTGGPVRSSPAIDAANHAVVGSMDGMLYGLGRGTGIAEDAGRGADAGPNYPLAIVAFAVPLEPIASSPVIAPDGTIYVGTTTGKLYAVPPGGGSPKWNASTNDTLGSSPALGQDGTIYIGSTDHALHAFEPGGAVKWASDLGAEIHGSPAVGGDGTVYVGTIDGKLHALDTAGKERWSYRANGPIRGTPAVYAGNVYVGSEDMALHAVSNLGVARWSYGTNGAAGSPVIGANGTVYFGSADGRMYAMTPKGSLFFAAVARGKVTSAPAITVGPYLYVATENGLAVLGP